MFLCLALPASAQVVAFSTYCGGSGPDRTNAVALDADGYIIVASSTFPANLPGVESGFQSNRMEVLSLANLHRFIPLSSGSKC